MPEQTIPLNFLQYGADVLAETSPGLSLLARRVGHNAYPSPCCRARSAVWITCSTTAGHRRTPPKPPAMPSHARQTGGDAALDFLEEFRSSTVHSES